MTRITLAVFVGLVALAIPTLADSQNSLSVSPDKQWEYRCDDGLWSSIKKTDTGKMVVDLSNEVSVPYCDNAEVIWAPDSKRFAFNYTPPHAPHSRYQTIAFFELRGGKWVMLPTGGRCVLESQSVSATREGALAKEPPLQAGRSAS